eukprot:56610_1
MRKSLEHITSPITKAKLYPPLYDFHLTLGGKYGVYNGIVQQPTASNEMTDYLRAHFKTTENDIITASVWKAGSTFLKKILLSIIQSSQSIKQELKSAPDNHRLKSMNLSIDIPVIEFIASQLDYSGWEKYEQQTNDGLPRLMHTHNHFKYIPFANIHKDSKVIYITRNPKDTAVSYHHFYSNIPDFKYLGNNENIKEGLNLFLCGLNQSGDYWDHNISWFKHDLNNELLFLYYEDLVNNPLESIKSIATFVKLDNELTDEDYVLIANQTVFDNMKKHHANNPGLLYEDFGMSNDNFFRKGKINDWVNYFDDTMSHLFDAKTRIKFSEIPHHLYYQQLL